MIEFLELRACLVIVSAHRRILGMAPVVCVLVKICVSSISFYKLDTDKLTTPFESAHQLYPPIGVVSAHRRILGMAPVVCVLVKICVSSISFYKLDTDKLTTPFESAHQFTLICTVSDSKTVPGCHYNLCSNHSFVLTD